MDERPLIPSFLMQRVCLDVKSVAVEFEGLCAECILYLVFSPDWAESCVQEQGSQARTVAHHDTKTRGR